MSRARESFLVQVRTPDVDTDVQELRQSLVRIKQDAMRQVEAGDEAVRRGVMPQLYEQVVQLQVHIAAHVGLGVALALSVLDDFNTVTSLSKFDRDAREQCTEIATDLTTRHASRLAKMVARIEGQRLVWRHSHEFMSWLAFRRGDERYPARDRLERLDAFGVQGRLLDARTVVMELLGVRLSAALESTDRFLLSNRWRLSDSPEHALERYVWPLMSYLPAAAVRLERARWEYDAAADAGADLAQLEGERAKLAGLLEGQLADALSELPETGYAGSL
jgi:hypothetical protein